MGLPKVYLSVTEHLVNKKHKLHQALVMLRDAIEQDDDVKIEVSISCDVIDLNMLKRAVQQEKG